MSKRQQKRQRFRHWQKEKTLKLNERRRQEFAALVALYPAERILYLPLDIAKNVHYFRADTAAGRPVHPPAPLPTDQAGYDYFHRQLHSALSGGQFDLVILGHEPTGVYHETWARALLTDFAPALAEPNAPRLLYRLLNPYQVKLEREKLNLRPHKSDPLDLIAMASLLQQGQGNPVTLPDPHLALLRQAVFFARHAAAQLKAARIELLRQFDRIWPGAVVNLNRFKQAHPDLPLPQPLVTSKPLDRQTLRGLLEHCPNPYHLRQLDPAGIIALFHHHGLPCGPKTAQRILDCARRALLNPPAVVEVYCHGLALLLADEQHWLDRQTWAEQQLASLVLHTPARHLLTIPGLTPTWAAYYLDLVGAPPHFDWADQVWAYVGFDPIRHQSGDSNPTKTFHLSRRGDPFHRHILTWMGQLVAGHHPTFGQHFIAAEQRGLGLWGAAIHTAHKLHRLCFCLLRENRPFYDDTPPDDFARWRAYWLAYRQYRRQPQRHPHPGPWLPGQ